MNSNTHRMIDAIAETGRVTLKALKARGIMVHAALCEMIDRGIKVRSTWSATDQSCVYWIGKPIVWSPNGRRAPELTRRELRAIADMAATGEWFSTPEIAERLSMHRDKSSKLVQLIKCGAIGDGITVHSRRVHSHRFEHRFEIAEAV